MTARDGDVAGSRAAGAGAAGGTLREHHAFLVRWGLRDEIDRRIAGLRGTASWWASKQPQAEDDEVGRSLRSAMEALEAVRRAARAVEEALADGGFEFDRHLRVLRRRRQQGPEGDGRDRRARRLLYGTILDVFEELRAQGGPHENTRELRFQIRARLAQSLHPDLLSDALIRTAVEEGLSGRD